MLKEKTKKFVKENKTKILIGGICVGASVILGVKIGKEIKEMKQLDKQLAGIKIPEVREIPKIQDVPKVKNVELDCIKTGMSFMDNDILGLQLKMDTMHDIANNSLGRERSRIIFTIEELETYIANLDHTKTINKFYRIPEKEKMIQDLKIQLKDIEFDQKVIKDAMSDIWAV